ncbi:MAG: hypothetical protein ACYCUY_10635, partial [Acidithiobacillus sp.]
MLSKQKAHQLIRDATSFTPAYHPACFSSSHKNWTSNHCATVYRWLHHNSASLTGCLALPKEQAGPTLPKGIIFSEYHKSMSPGSQEHSMTYCLTAHVAEGLIF